LIHFIIKNISKNNYSLKQPQVFSETAGLFVRSYSNYNIYTISLFLISSCCFSPFPVISFKIFVVVTLKPFGNAVQTVFSKNLIFFLLKFNMFWIVLMCWCQKWFLKNKKNIINMYFSMKNYLKSNRKHNLKHTCQLSS
jgi:hypothetical protein